MIPEHVLLLDRFLMCKIQRFSSAIMPFEKLQGLVSSHFLIISFVFTIWVYHSVFQTVSRRSIYIKNINYSGSILANLNNTMQTKQHATKKKAKLVFK